MTAKQKAAREKFKKVVAEAGKLRKKNPSLTQGQAVKQAFAISYSKAGESKKVGAVKKKAAPKKKAAGPKKVTSKKAAQKKDEPKKVTGSHKDTKSHNVNIRVVSGIKNQNKKLLTRISVAQEELFDVLRDIEAGKGELKKEIFLKNKSGIEYWKNHNKWALNYSKELKEHIQQLKKHIK